MANHVRHRCLALSVLDSSESKCSACRDFEDLFFCEVCGTFEGGLATECPGWHLPSEVVDLIYRGEVDFKGGEWVT